MADPYGLFDNGSLLEMGGMRGSGGGSYAPSHQGMMGAGMMGMSDPGMMGAMMPQVPQQQQQQPNPQAMNTYGQVPQQLHPTHSPKLQHYGQYAEYGAPPSAARLHHMGAQQQQQGAMPQHQQMAPGNPMMSQQMMQPQYPPVHRQVNPSQHPMYSMHNNGVGGPTHHHHPQPPAQQQQQPMQMNQSMMWGTPQYPMHSQQQQQSQQPSPHQHGPPPSAYAQRQHEYGSQQGPGVDPATAQRLAHYSDEPGGGVPHIQQHQMGAGKLGPMGVQQRPQGSPSYSSVAGYHTTGPDPSQTQRTHQQQQQQQQQQQPQPAQHNYSYGIPNEMGHLGQQQQGRGGPVKQMPQYGASYGPNGAVQGQPYQMPQQPQPQQQQQQQQQPHSHGPMSDSLGPRPHYSPATQAVPNGSPQYRPAYPQVTLSPRRPTPTPPTGSPMPPPSHTPDRHILPPISATQAQGTYRTPSPSLSPSLGQSSLQQLEQMVVPHVGNRSSPLPPPLPQTHSGPFHAPTGHSSPQVSVVSGLGQTQYQPNASVDQRQQLHGHSVTVPNTSTTSVVGGGVQTVTNTPPNSSSIGSPSMGVSSPGNLGGGGGGSSGSTSRQPSPMGRIQGPLGNAVPLHPGYEVQQLQQQLHQFYGMPQTPQTRQKIMEIQEQLRLLQQPPMPGMPQPPLVHHGAMVTGMQTPPHGHEPPQPLQHTHPPLQQQQQVPPSSQGPSSMGMPSSPNVPLMGQVPPQPLPLPPPPPPILPIIATQQPLGMGPMYHHSEMHSPQGMSPASSQGLSMGPSQPQPISIMSQMMTDASSFHHQSPSHPSMGLMPPDGLDEVSRASTTELTMLPHMQAANDEMSMCLPHNEQNSCDSLLGSMDSSNMMMPFNQMQEPVLTDLSQSQPPLCPPAKIRKQAKPKVPKIPKPRKPKKKKGSESLPLLLPLPPSDPVVPMEPIAPSMEPEMDFQLLELQPPQMQQPQPQEQEQLQPESNLEERLQEGDLLETDAVPPADEMVLEEEKPKKKSKKSKKPKLPKDEANPDDPDEQRTPKKSKPKTPKKPKEPKTPKEPKEKKPKKPKEPKTPKEPKPLKDPKPVKEPKEAKPVKEAKTPKEPKKTKETTTTTKDKKAKSPKEKPEGVDVVKPKTSKASKRRPTKLVLSFSKKRKRTGSTDNSDMEATPPPSPEGVEDVSLKRRSARNTKRKKYVDDIDVAITDEEDMVSAIVAEQLDKTPKPNEAGLIKPVQFFVNPNEEDAMLVERILSMRTVTKEPSEEGGEAQEVEEFYVKYKNFSYLHCDWKTHEELEKGDKRVMLKIKRYKQKKASGNNIFEFLEEEAFNPDYIEVDRILDVSCEITDIETNAQTKHFLVKWRGLAYDDSTWELEEDVDKDKIEQFYKFRQPPPSDQIKPRKRPKPEDWKKLEASRLYKHNNTLREYQLEGVNWLTFSWYNGQNCILADEMGLGKTIQSITYLYEVIQYGIRGPFLVIAPLSTITNWQREFESWSDMNVVVYHGSAASRNMIQEYETYYKDDEYKIIPNVYKFNAMITTFEIIITDCMDLRAIPWQCVIIDEAHRLKNKNCKLLEGLRLLQMEHRVLLSGTPLQNNVEELFSLLNFLEPTQFPSSEDFLKEFGDLKSESQVQKLQQLLKPMMLRRLKEDVEKSLAPKEETIIEVELTNIQKKYYRAILERNFSFLAKGGGSANIPNLMNTMMELRKCCIHPYLINGAEEQIQSECKMGTVSEGDDSYLQAMIQSSGKLVLIDKLLPKLKDSGHRVLIFSQMVRCLDILEDYLVHRRYPFERIDGRVRGNMRQAAIDRFSKPDSDRFVFLLCTRAGGLGINLTAADTVIIFDSDWNPQNDLQAQARCHRIGQQKMVKCYRLICRNTYEREMFDKASLKLGLDKAVLQSMNSSTKDGIPPQQLSKKEIEDLLRKGAYGAIMDDDNAADKFCEEDIDQILKRRTQVIQLESGVKGSTFAKASFVASGNRSDIDIDDPEFWQKWARRADIDVEALDRKNDLIVTQPRRRIQTRRFGNEDQVLEMTDLESSDDDDSMMGLGRRSHKKSRSRKRKREDYHDEFLGDLILGIWSRTECFKVEKGLLTFGWGRWMELLNTMKFKMRLQEGHLEEVSRIILLYCLRFYRGDEKIKTFVFDLITPTPSIENKIHRNHSDPSMSLGLTSPPSSRSRKSKKVKKELKVSPNYGGSSMISNAAAELIDWTKDPKYNPDVWLTDEGYKKHLQRHANKVLLRVRLLSYLKQDIVGDQVLRVAEGMHVSLLNMRPPWPDGDPPVPWWDDNADKSLLVGVYKHGYERYNVMRLDPTLSFLAKCGPPDGAAVLAEMNINETNEDELEDKVSKLDDVDDDEPLSPGTPKPELQHTRRPDHSKSIGDFVDENESDVPLFPSVSDLNTRLRRLITGYQRNHKKQEQRQAQRAKKMEKKEKFQAAVREREMRKKELQQRKWSRREEADFYRVVASFGVEFIARENRYDWNRFRNLARLEKKYDDTVTEYFKAFYVMCKKVCGKKVTEEEENQPIFVEPITEERARRCLERVDLLNKIREEILPHPELEERLKLCKPSMDLPEWWICGKHDKDLLVGAARHGLGRMDYQLLHDPALSFHEVLRNYKPNKQTTVIQSNSRSSPALVIEKNEEEVKEEEAVDSVKEEAPDVDVKTSTRKNKLLPDPSVVDDVKPSEELDAVKEESDGEKVDKKKSEEKDSPVVKEESIDEDKDESVDAHDEKINRDELADKEVSVADEVESASVESVKQKEEADVVSDIVTNAIDTVVEESEKEKAAEDRAASEKTVTETEVPKEQTTDSEIDENDLKCVEKQTEEEQLKVDSEVSPVKLLEESAASEVTKETDTLDEEKETSELEKENELVEGPETINCDADKVKEVEIDDDVKGSLEELESKEVPSVESVDESKDELKTEKEEKLKIESIASSDNELKTEKQDEKEPKLKAEEEMDKTEEKTEEKEVDDSAVEKVRSPSAVKDEDETKMKEEEVKSSPTDLQVINVKEEESASVVPSSTLDLYASTTFGLEMISGGADSAPAHLLVNSFHNPIRWPKDRVLQMRLEAVVQCIEKNEWPIIRYTQMFPLQPLSQSNTPASVDMDSTPQVTPDQTPKRETTPWNTPTHPSEKDGSDSNTAPEPVSNTIPYPPRRRRRRRRIEIEAERAKLQALLSQNLNHNQLKIKYPIFAGENMSQEPSKSVSSITISPVITNKSSSSSVAPPPAHQQAHQHNSMRAGTQLLGTLDLGRKLEALRQEETQAPMDLSSSLKGGPSFAGDQSDRSSVDGASFGVTEGLVMDLQLRRTKKMRLEEQLAKIKNQKVGCDTFVSASTSSNLTKVDDQRQRKRRKLDEIVGSLAASAAPITTPAPAHSSSLKTTMVTNVPSEPIVKKPITTTAATTMAAAAAAAVAAKAQLEPNLRSNHLLHLASKRLDVEKWLADHSLQAMARRVETARPAMTPDPMELLDGRRRRRPRLDPNKLSLDHLTGNENVSVINRLTGKKITGSKAPPLKHLAEWLKQNPMFDVDTKWAHLVKEKNLGLQASLPDDVKKRILFPSGRRGRRPGSTSSSLNPPQQSSTPPRSVPSSTASLLSSTYSSLPGLGALGSLANANMLAGFPNLKLPGMSDPSRGGTSAAASAANSPMFLPFGGLASLGLTNPLFANLAGLGFAGFPFASSLSGLTPGNHKGSKESGGNSIGIGSKTSSGLTTTTSSSAAAAAASLPLLFPAPGLLYNPLGLGNFPLPTSIPSSFASLAHAGLVNGMTSQSTSRMGSSVTATTSSAFGSRSATIGFGNPSTSSAVNATTNGMLDDSDDDSLRSLMGNHYDDDDSTATDEDVHHSRQPQKTETQPRHRHAHQAQKSHQSHKKELDVARLMAADSKHQSRPSKTRTSLVGQESRPRRTEQSMADKFEAKALQRSMMQMMEAKTLERSRRAERRSNDKIHRSERTLSRSRSSMNDRLAEAMAAEAKERRASARDLSVLSSLSVSTLSPSKTSVAQDAATNLVLSSTSDSKSVSKPVELVRRTSGRSVEESKEVGNIDAVRTEGEASGERIRMLSEKLKEKLHRAEEVCRELGVGSCTVQKSEDAPKVEPVVCRPLSAVGEESGTIAASVADEEPAITNSKPGEGDDEKS